MDFTTKLQFAAQNVEFGDLVSVATLGQLKPHLEPGCILVFRSKDMRTNFTQLALGRALGIPSLPLRFELEREAPVLPAVKVKKVINLDLQMWQVPGWEEVLQGCAYLNLSSGTSLRRTVAFPTDDNLQANAEANCQTFGIDDNRQYWCTFPFYAHCHEIFSKSAQANLAVLAIHPSELDSIRTLLKTGIQLHILSTPHVALSYLAKHLKDWSEQIRFELAGEYVALGVVKRLQEQGFGVAISWGSAETSGVAIADLNPQRASSIGVPLPGYQLGTLTLDGPMNLSLEGPAIPPYLYASQQLFPTEGRFTSKDQVSWANDTLIFEGRTDGFFKIFGTYIDKGLVERWAKSFESVDNAFLGIQESGTETKLVLFVQGSDAEKHKDIESGIRSSCVKEYGAIKLHIVIRTALLHTPTGKLIRDVDRQLEAIQGDPLS